MPSNTASLSIADWKVCLEADPHVLRVKPLLDENGMSKKSFVPEHVQAQGGGHLCPYELEVFIGGLAKKDRVVSGFTKNRKFLHTYFRRPGQRANHRLVATVFIRTCKNFQRLSDPEPSGATLSTAPLIPPPPPLLVTIAKFEGRNYGAEYLNFAKAQQIMARQAPKGCDPEGWAYGVLMDTGALGWYPPAYAK